MCGASGRCVPPTTSNGMLPCTCRSRVLTCRGLHCDHRSDTCYGPPCPIHGRIALNFNFSRCPCRVENGGSGICGCTLSGPRITNSTGAR